MPLVSQCDVMWIKIFSRKDYDHHTKSLSANISTANRATKLHDDLPAACVSQINAGFVCVCKHTSMYLFMTGR